jgi:hypothetical protein
MAPTQESLGSDGGDLEIALDAIQRTDGKLLLWLLVAFLATVVTSVVLLSA